MIGVPSVGKFLAIFGKAFAWIAANPAAIASLVKVFTAGVAAAHADPAAKAAGNEALAHFPDSPTPPPV